MHVAICYKNFAAYRNISHIGLGVAAINTSKVLRRAGINSHVWPITSADDLRSFLLRHPVDQCIISAPWLKSNDLLEIASHYPETQFTVVVHSNCGFLQADQNGVRLIKELMELEMGTHNIHLAGNSLRFTDWVKATFNTPCAFLPNLYYLDSHAVRPQRQHHGGPIRIGIFGAQRPLKNIMSATAAAIEIGTELREAVELFISSERAEGGGEVVIGAVRQMIEDIPHITLKNTGWQSWPKFRKTVGHMHLLLQPSYTESFNIVTADGIAEGVPSVVSPAIDWVPSYWQAEPDDVMSIAEIGRRHLTDPRVIHDGLKSLQKYVADGIKAYESVFAEVH